MDHSSGPLAAAARKRLAELALRRAGSVADLRLLIERYAGTPEAKRASKRVADLLARAAMDSGDVTLLQAFLDDYPQHPMSARVEEQLAALRLSELDDDVVAIERFIDRHSQTAAAGRARERLAALQAAEVLESGDAVLLDAFNARFPEDPRLPQLRDRVRSRRVRRALVRLDLEALRDWSRPGFDSPSVRTVARWCDRARRRCERLRQLAAAAAPWRPRSTLQQLRELMYGLDVLEAWRAIAALGMISHAAAGDQLLDAVASSRMLMVWPAEQALRRWLGHLTAQARRQWLSRELSRKPRPINDDDLQRFAALALLGPHPSDGMVKLRSLLDKPGRTLAAAFLLVRAGQRGTAVSKLVASVSERVRQLEQAFPNDIPQEGALTAAMAERELVVLAHVLATIKDPPPRLSAQNRAVQRRIDSLLAAWRPRLAQATPEFRPANLDALDSEVDEHRRQRKRALLALLRRKDSTSRVVARAVCETIGDEARRTQAQPYRDLVDDLRAHCVGAQLLPGTPMASDGRQRDPR